MAAVVNCGVNCVTVSVVKFPNIVKTRIFCEQSFLPYLQHSKRRILQPQENAATINSDFLLHRISAPKDLEPGESLIESFSLLFPP